MTPPTDITDKSNLSFEPEISPSMVYRELERFHIDTIYDPIASMSGAAGYFKLQNVRVIGNDLALYAYIRGKALWENNIFTIPDSVTDRLTDPDAKLPEPYHYRNLGGDWLSDIERKWLEYWRKAINDTRDEYIRALAETSVCLVIDYWITAKRFGMTHEWTPNELLKFYILHINRSVLNNEESNEMWRTDPEELTTKVIADVLFMNPPPLKGYGSLGAREEILESWLRGMGRYRLNRIAPDGSLGAVYGSTGDYLKSMSRLLQAANHIPIWAFALSNRQPFTRPEFQELLRSLGRGYRESDLGISRQFFSRRAVDTIMIAMK